MTRWERWLQHLANGLVGGTGLVYAAMLYLLSPADEFAVVNHPWQPAVQHLHVVSAPLLVFAIGALWRLHAWAGLRYRVELRRTSGLALVATATPMIASGYLLQTAGSPVWRGVWLAVHLSASALWLAGYLAHQLGPRRP